MAEEVQDIAIQEGTTPQTRKVPSMDEVLGTKTKKVPSMEEVLGNEKKNSLSSQYVSSPTQSPLASPNFSQGEKMAKVGFTIPSAANIQHTPEQQNWLLNTISSLDKGFYKNLIGNPTKGLGTALQGATKKAMGGKGEGLISNALIKFGDYFNKTIDELTPQDEEFKNSLSDQVAQALGTVGSMVLTGAASGMGKGSASLMNASQVPKANVAINAAKEFGKDLINPVSVSAGLSMGQSEFDKAKQLGATDDQAFEAFYKNAAVGSILEQIPTMQFLKRFNQSTGGGIANYIKTKGIAGITGGLEELSTEVLQQLYANKTAKDIYNINQDLFEGVAESGGIGFGVGFLLNALGANAKILRKQGNKVEAEVIKDQVDSFKSKMENASKEEDKIEQVKQQEQQKNGIDKRQEQFDVFSQLASSNPNFKFTDSFDEFNNKINSEGGEQYLKDLYNQSKPFVQTGDLGEVETNTEDNFVNYLKPKEEVEPIEEISVYHGGSIDDLSKAEGGLFVSEDKNQAAAYAKGNNGNVQEFKINKNDISDEAEVRKIIVELGLKSKQEGWDLSKELMLHEILDPRFETSLSDADLSKLYTELEKRGYKAIKMSATDVTGKEFSVDDILVLNPKETLKIEVKPIEEQLKPKENAVQKSSTEGVLPLTPNGNGEEGGKREGMGQGVQGKGITQEGETTQPESTTKENVIPPPPPIQEDGEKKEPLRTNEKAILKRLFESKNISEDVKNKFKDNLKYKTASKEEARNVAKEFVKEYGSEDAVTLAEAGKFDGDVNSFIFAEAIDNAARKEMEAKTEEEKIKYASEWADYAMRYDEAARKGGRFISAISDFYKKSPLGVLMVEKANRENSFKEWFKNKEKSYKEVFDELIKEPEFKDLMDEKVQSELKEERKKTRADKRQKIDDFFEKAKLKGNNLYAVPIPPQVINSALEVMKQAVLAGESIVNAVGMAVEHISKEVKDWDKEKFKKEYEEKLSQFETSKTTKTESELTKDKQDKMLDSFRKKLKGLNEEQKADVIRRSFKKLVENGALEYDDFKKIIQDVMGNGELTQEEQDKIKDLVTKINSVEDVAKSIREDDNRSEENLKKYKEAKKEAEQASTELGKMVYNKINLTNRVLSIMQLNTLGIPSLINNPIFNIWNQSTVRFPIGVQLSVIDQILYGGSKVSNKLFGTSILYPENNIFISQKSFFSKLGEGAKQSTEQLFTGLTNADYFQKEVRSSQIHPFTSIKELWDWKFNGKPLTKEQVADKLLQAGPGFTAEIVARLLNIGDKPQRYAAEGAQAAVFAKKLGLKGVDLKYFMEFPKEEAYRAFKKQGLSDEVAMQKAEEMLQRIIKQGEESTFQQNSLLNDAIQGAFKPFGKFGDVIKTLNMPYVKIPLNAFWSVYNLINPEVAFLQSAVYGLKAIKSKSSADIQESKKWFAHAVTGMALTAIVGALAKAKIINSDNDDETTKKERMGEKSFEQQNSINVSKLNAYLRGENPDDVKDGLNVDLKWFGNVGNVMNVTSQKLENMTPEQKKNGMSYMEDMMERQSESAKEFVNNGVFANTSGLLTAATKGGQFWDAYGLNLINMGANVIQPAMFAQMSRAQLPYYSQQKADSFMKELENSMLTRSGTLRTIMKKYPPSQNNIWGERMDRKDNVIMKLFGMSKTDPDNFAQPIYKDYKRTDNTKFFPPSIKPEVNNKPITNDQLNKLEVLVGQKRKMLVAPFINDGATLKGFKNVYSKLSDDDKVDALNIIYKMAYNEGEKDFVSLYPDFYASKKKTKEQKKETKENRIFKKSLTKFLK